MLTTTVLSDTLQENLHQSIEDCIDRAGFEYVSPEAVAPVAGSAIDPSATDGYGIVLSHTAAAIEAQVAAEEEAREENLEYAEALPPEATDLYLEVIGEAPPSGVTPGEPSNCMEAASETVLQPAMEAQQELGETAIRVSEAVEARPEIQDADKVWSECMARGGHDFASPSEAEQSIVSALSGPTAPNVEAVLTTERQVATADEQCRQETGYMSTLTQVSTQEWEAADIDVATINEATGAVQ